MKLFYNLVNSALWRKIILLAGFIFLISFIFSGNIDNPITAEEPEFVQTQEQLIENLEKVAGIDDQKVLEAMSKIERHKFVLEDYIPYAYVDMPLPIGYQQNISAPHMIALMTSLLDLEETSRVLEIRTRAGYHTAILAEIAAEVFTLEAVTELKELAENNLDELGYTNVNFKVRDVYLGWDPEESFDAVVVKGSIEEVPPFLLDQLKDGGNMIIPLGAPEEPQMLTKITRVGDDYLKEEYGQVNFIPIDWEPGVFN